MPEGTPPFELPKNIEQANREMEKLCVCPNGHKLSANGMRNCEGFTAMITRYGSWMLGDAYRYRIWQKEVDKVAGQDVTQETVAAKVATLKNNLEGSRTHLKSSFETFTEVNGKYIKDHRETMSAIQADLAKASPEQKPALVKEAQCFQLMAKKAASYEKGILQACGIGACAGQ